MQDPNILGLLANAGLAGLVLLLFLRGWIVAKPAVDRMTRDADRWRRLYETERTAHETTRKAHAEETRAYLVASAEGAQVAAAVLTAIKDLQGEAHQ